MSQIAWSILIVDSNTHQNPYSQDIRTEYIIEVDSDQISQETWIFLVW